MDPVTLILAALAAGATKVAGEAAPDAYRGLKALIRRRFAGNPKAELALVEHEEDPDTYEKPLAKQLEATGAAQDTEILAAARELLRASEQAGLTQIGKYNVQISGGKVGVVGDQAHVTM